MLKIPSKFWKKINELRNTSLNDNESDIEQTDTTSLNTVSDTPY